MKQRTICALRIAAVLLGIANVGYAANDRFYVAAIQPNDVAPGSTQNFNLTVTNNILSGPSHFLRQVIVTVPSAFVITGNVTVQAPIGAPLPWTVAVNGHTVTVTSGSVSDASVTAGQGITITVPAQVPSGSCASSASYPWGIKASQVAGGGQGNAYLLTPGTSNPSVKVSCDLLTSLNLAVAPGAIGTTNTSAQVTLTATLTKVVGGSLVNGETITFKVGGQPVTCSSGTNPTVNGVATCSYFPQASPNTPLPAGDYDCLANFDGDAALGLGSSVSQPVTLTVNATATALVVAPASGAFGGTANLSATLTTNGVPVSGKTITFQLGSTVLGSGTTTNASGVSTISNVSLSGINVGIHDQFIQASFAGDSGTNAPASGDATLTVTSVSTGLAWSTPTGIVYGTALSGTQLNATASVSGNFVYSPPAGTVLNAGNGQTLSVTFTPDDLINYSSATTTVNIDVGKATAVILVTPYNTTYNGSPHTASGTAMGLGGVDLSAGLNLSGTTHTDVGDYTADSWTFSGGNNYSDAGSTVHDIISGASQTITFTSMTVTAAATSGATTMFTSGTPAICSVTQVLVPGNTTPVNPGQATVVLLPGQTDWSLCKVLANQNGANTNYSAAPQVTATLSTQ